MLYRITQTLLTCLLLYGVSQAYAVAVRPLIAQRGETPDLQAHFPNSASVNVAPKDHIETAEKYLPNEKWALNAKIRVHRENMFIFCGNWERTNESKSVRFSPFAIVFHPKPKPGEVIDPDKEKSAVTIVADSALIEFSKSVKLNEIDPDLIDRGILNGKVRVEGTDGLKLDGQEFIFDRSANHVRSDHHIEFSWNGHKGQANSFEMELLEDEEKGFEEIAYKGVKTVILRKAIELFLQPEKEPFPVHVRAAGSLHYQYETMLATLQNDVQVDRMTSATEADSLRCQQLNMAFQEKPEDKKKKKEDDESSNMELLTLEALGQLVILSSAENEMTANLKRLVYNAKTKTTTLSSDTDVWVQQSTNKLNCPLVEITQNEKGDLIALNCEGKGRLTHVDEVTQQPVFDAEWQKQLTLKPDEQSGGQFSVIEILQKAILRQPQKKSGLVADKIRVWIDQSKLSMNMKKGKEKTKSTEKKRTPPDAIKRMIATDNIAIVSPMLEGEIEEEIEIVFEPQSPERLVKAQIAAMKESAKEKDDSEKEPNTLNQPMILSAKKVQIRVEIAEMDDSEENESKEKKEEPFFVTDVVTSGNVELDIFQPKLTKPLKVSADWLHLVNGENNEQRLSLEGRPARITDMNRGFGIEGETVLFDRQRNLARVDSAGLMQMPIANSLDGKELETPQQLFVSWNEQMLFDGNQARFIGQVKSTLAEGSMSCEEMIATLSQKVDFSEPPDKQTKIKLSHVLCRDQVLFYLHQYEDNKLTEIRRAGAWEIELDQTTGKTSARGPGWLQFWTRGEQKMNVFEQKKKVEVAKAEKKKDKKQWQYMRIDFAGTMTGNIEHKISKLHDRVRVLYGPVDKPLDLIDRDELPDTGGWLTCEELEFLQKANANKGTDEDSMFNLKAQNNAVIQGNLFRARADQITFDSENELFMLRGHGKNYATIWRREKAGQKADRTDAKSIQFSPMNNHIEFDRSTGVQARSSR